tara:strand:- start:2801 stop:3685 length:885 start_codon:yes stop_codon:yes gene_type:complete
MALSFDNVKERVLERVFEGLAAVDDQWTKVFKIHQLDAAGLRIASMEGIGDLPTWDGTSSITTASVDAMGAKDISYVAKGISAHVGYLDERDIPNLVSDAARKIGVSVASTQASQAYTAMNQAFGSLTTADGKALYATDHTTTSGTRSNLGTSALSTTAVMAAVTSLNQWVNFQDQKFPQAMNGEKLYLCVNPSLYATAVQIAQSQFTDSNLQVNAARGLNIEVIQSPHLGALDWHLVVDPMVNGGPFVAFDRMPLEVVTTRDQDTKTLKITATYAMGVSAHPDPTGAFGGLLS